MSHECINGHSWNSSSKCSICGERLRCDFCHVYIREDNLEKHHSTCVVFTGIKLLEQGNKRCGSCGVIKSINQFGKHAIRNNGLDVYCKVCNQKRSLLLYSKSKLTDRYKERRKQNQREYTLKHPEVAKAHRLAKSNKDELMKESCEKCGRKDNLHMHHPDYSKPLMVITLCIACHEEVHHGVAA